MLLRRLEPHVPLLSPGCRAEHSAVSSCVHVQSLSWFSLSVQLWEAELAERLQCPHSLALFVALSLKRSILDPSMPVPFQVLSKCDSLWVQPPAGESWQRCTDLDGAMYIYSRRRAGSVLSNIPLIFIMCLISMSSCGFWRYPYMSLDNCYQS